MATLAIWVLHHSDVSTYWGGVNEWQTEFLLPWLALHNVPVCGQGVSLIIYTHSTYICNHVCLGAIEYTAIYNVYLNAYTYECTLRMCRSSNEVPEETLIKCMLIFAVGEFHPLQSGHFFNQDTTLMGYLTNQDTSPIRTLL